MVSTDDFLKFVASVELAAENLARSAYCLDTAYVIMESGAIPEELLTEYHRGRLRSALSQFDSAAQYAALVFERWDNCPDDLGTSTEPSQPSLTASGSIPNLRLHGIASFEPELLPGSSED